MAALDVVLEPVVAQPAVGQEHAVEVDLDGAVPFVKGNIHDLVRGPEHGGIDKDVDLAEFFEGEVEKLVHLIFFGSVALAGIGALGAARGVHIGEAGLGLLVVGGIGDDDLCALFDEAQAASAADVGGTADDNGYFILQTQIHDSIPFCR